MKTGSPTVLLRLIGGGLAGVAFGIVLAVLGGLSVGSGHGSDLPIRLAFVIDHPLGLGLWPAIGVLLAWRESTWSLLLGIVLLAASVVSAGLLVVRETGSLQLFPQVPDTTIFSALGLFWFGFFELVAWVVVISALFRRVVRRSDRTRRASHGIR